MTKKLIKKLEKISENYNTFFIDLWGVIHNGIRLYPEAINVLDNLQRQKKRFVLMSNAPVPSKQVKKFLLKINMNEIYTESIFTSGEAALQNLKNNTYGKNFYHLGPKKDNSLFVGLEKNKKNLENADFILCTGLLDNHESSLKFYEKLLSNHTHLNMVCTNPDLVVHRGNEREYCAGSVAEIFKKLGGKVFYFGKPYPEIYKSCMKDNDKTLVIGDNIRTDIKGANNMNLDSLLIIDGVHKMEFINKSIKNYDNILDKYETKTNYYQKKLVW